MWECFRAASSAPGSDLLGSYRNRSFSRRRIDFLSFYQSAHSPFENTPIPCKVRKHFSHNPRHHFPSPVGLPWPTAPQVKPTFRATLPKGTRTVHQVKYDLADAQSSLEFILEQVIYGTVVIIVRQGIEIARVTAVEGLRQRATTLMGAPYEL